MRRGTKPAKSRVIAIENRLDISRRQNTGRFGRGWGRQFDPETFDTLASPGSCGAADEIDHAA
jgi:hypothetical protein